MKFTKMTKKIRIILITFLLIILLTTHILPVFANSQFQESSYNLSKEAYDFFVTVENFDNYFDKFFDIDFEDYRFYIEEEAIEKIWTTIFNNALAEVAMMTMEEVEVALNEIEEAELEEKYFWENLSPEFLWQQYMIDNPSVISMHRGEINEIKQELFELYEFLTMQNQYERIAPQSIDADGPIRRFTRLFAADAGQSLAVRTAIEAQGTLAINDAVTARNNNGWPAGGHREDAFRHWVWNARSVRASTVGNTQALRTSRTRTYTTYREIASFVVRHGYILHGINMHISTTNANITVAQNRVARTLRNYFLAMNQTAWMRTTANSGGMNTANGRSEQMDLWNNHWGRVDGVAGAPTVARFNQRWNVATGNTGLVRSNSLTGTAQMNETRQRHLHSQGWHRPQ
jgi:ABC-type maltose transport system permease subunit